MATPGLRCSALRTLRSAPRAHAAWFLGLALAASGCGVPEVRAPPAPPPEVLAGARFDPYAALVEALRSGQPPLQAAAAETFLESDRPPPRAEVESLVDTADPRVRTTIVALLGAARRADLASLFQRKFRDADANVRLAAAFALAMAGDPSQVTMLRDGLASPDVTQRRTAAWLLGLMGNPSAAGLLKVKLADPDAVVVLRAAEALHRLGRSDGLQEVRTLTEHERHEVRYWAVRLLGRVGDTTDIPRLEKLCQSRFLDVRFAAIAAAAQRGDLKRIAFLLDMLDVSVSTLREQAATDKDLADLLQQMSEADVAAFARDMRVLAARELGETAYTPALDRLEKLLARGELPERTAAACAIVRILSTHTSWRSRILADRPPPLTPTEGPPAAALPKQP
ncbi:MAG: hypothetical protein FJ288_01190 [Planctomycetes bacterium]|nr:hypothetical protein [Planctomycetota bacterium]